MNYTNSNSVNLRRSFSKNTSISSCTRLRPGISALAAFFVLFCIVSSAAWKPVSGQPDKRFEFIKIMLNTNSIAGASQPAGCNFYKGYAFPADELPGSNAIITVNGIPFRFPPISPGKPDNFAGDVSARNDYGKMYFETARIGSVPGYFSKLYLLASSEGPGRNELGLMLYARDFATAWVPRWDQAGIKGGAVPGIEVKRMFKNGSRVNEKGTIWLITIPVNPNDYGAGTFSFGPYNFPERIIPSDTHIFAATVEKALVYFTVVSNAITANHTFPDYPFATLKIHNNTARAMPVTLHWECVDINKEKVFAQKQKLNLPANGSETRKLDFNPGKRGYYHLRAWVADKNGKCLTSWIQRTGILPPILNKANMHVNADSGPVGSYGVRWTDRTMFDYRTGRVNGEAELNIHDPSEAAIDMKIARARNPGKKGLAFGASGPAFQWWERSIDNGSWTCIDALWLEPVICPRAPESLTAYWKSSAAPAWRKFLKKYGDKTLVARLNVQGTPHDEPGLGISWVDQGVEDDLLGKWVARAIVTLAMQCKHIALTDSWGRTYNARWWDAWGMSGPLGPYARAITGPATMEHLNGANFKGLMDIGENNLAYVFEKDGKLMIVAWTGLITPQKASIPVGAGSVKVQDVFANEKSFKAKGNKLDITLTDMPQFIYGVGKSVLKQLIPEEPVERVKLLEKKGDQQKICMALYAPLGIRSDHGRKIVKAAPGEKIPSPLILRVYNFNTKKAASGSVKVSVPDGWKAQPETIKVNVPPYKETEVEDPKTKKKKTVIHDHVDYKFTVTVGKNAQEVENRIFAEGKINGAPTERVSFDYIWVVDPKIPVQGPATVVAAPKQVTVDGDLGEWEGVPVFELRHWKLAGNEHGRHYFQNNYIYHWAKTNFQADVRFSYDAENFYIGMDVDDPVISTELPAIYTYSGILDHSDMHIVKVKNLSQDGFFSFMFFPSGVKEPPYVGDASDPFPIIRDASVRNHMNQMGEHPMNEFSLAMKEHGEGQAPGYSVEFAFPLKFINAKAGKFKEVELQIETLDADETMLYFYNWFNEKNNKASVKRGKALKPVKKEFVEVFKNPGDYASYKFEGKPVSCGLLGTLTRPMGKYDDPAAFTATNHADAEQVYFSGAGYFEYVVDGKLVPADSKRVVIGTEISSEFPTMEHFCYVWPSEVTFWVNGKEAGTYMVPGDVVSGWWVELELKEDGTYLHGRKVSDKPLSSYGIKKGKPITLRIGVKSDAKYRNGINIYGDRSSSGKHGRDISLRFYK